MPPFASSRVDRKAIVADRSVNEFPDCVEEDEANNNVRPTKISTPVNIDGFVLFEGYLPNQEVRYYYSCKKFGIVWRNVSLFVALHTFYLLSFYACLVNKCWYTWMFGYFYGFLGGLGVTAGSHRLWSHKSYKAKLPLRMFLCVCHSIAGQNDLFEWCRDHRVHHKFSETDADPHNSKRGFFFAHVGWLLTRKHPDVLLKGRNVDCRDLLSDPVVRVHKKFYIAFYLLFCFLLPWLIPVYCWSEGWINSLLIGVFWRYCTSLHCTWFVNSAAHMWGDRPYNLHIEPRENRLVSFGAFGEGFHNYHHTFPWDYSTSELGWKLNATTAFIDIMAWLGQAYDLKQLSPELIKQRKLKVASLGKI